MGVVFCYLCCLTQVPKTSAFVESDPDVIQGGEIVLTEFGIKGKTSGDFITHSSAFWAINTNTGIYGATGATVEEQWDFHYFDDANGKYYKLVHAHDMTHFLKVQGAPHFNPTVLTAAYTRFDDQYIRWNLVQSDGTTLVEGAVANTGSGVTYYLVNVGRDRCMAVHYAVMNPGAASFSHLQDSVTSEAKTSTGNWPSSCEVELIDLSQATTAPPV